MTSVLVRYCDECGREQPVTEHLPRCCGRTMLLVRGCTVIVEPDYKSVEVRLETIRNWQQQLRGEIDRLPIDSPERQGKINMLFSLHDEIEEITRPYI